jgi:hypothetical protein
MKCLFASVFCFVLDNSLSFLLSSSPPKLLLECKYVMSCRSHVLQSSFGRNQMHMTLQLLLFSGKAAHTTVYQMVMENVM